MEKTKLAACGIDCTNCASYKVTVEKDINAAEQLVEWYRESGRIEKDEGAEAILKKSPICKGCWNRTEDCSFKCGCYKIDFCKCCIEKNINHCGECKDFPCEYYKVWVSWHESHSKAMEHLISLRG